MIRALLASVLVAAAVRAEEPSPRPAPATASAAAPAAAGAPVLTPASATVPATAAVPASATEATPASAVAPRTGTLSLPPVSGGQQYGAPGSLPPVTAQLFHVGGMFELMPIVQVSLGDPFWRTVAAGLRAEQHLDERWSISVHALGGFGLIDAPVDVCGTSACSSATQAQLRAAPGRLSFLTGAELGWAPIYGKLSVFGDYTIHFDAYVSAGPELVREIIAPDTTSAEAGRWTYGGRVSVGERVFLTNTFMIRLAASELVYSGSVRGSGEIERKLSVEGGVAWLFGVGR